MPKQTGEFYEFGPFRVVPQERLLLREGNPVPLPPKAFDVLTALVRNHGHLLEKEELLKTVWPDVIVEEANLAQNVSLLRRALGESPEGKQYIETVPRSGYRFAAEVSEVPASNQELVLEERSRSRVVVETAEKSRAYGWFAHRRAWLAAASLLPVAAAVLLAVSSAVRSRWFGSRIESLAVLPLENLSRDPEQDYFADGMTEALIADLAKIESLRVISQSAVMGHRGARKPLREIARELKADALVEGSVTRSGDQVRITARLIHVPTGRYLWAESYERNLRDILELQKAVARAIADQIRIKVAPQEQVWLAKSRPVDPEAYRLYLLGRYWWNRRTGEAFTKALEYFQQAIEKDATYASAWVGLADCYGMFGSTRALPSIDAFPRSKAAAMKALEIDDTLAEAHASLARVKTLYEWDWVGAETEFRRAIELNPNYATAHHWYAFHLVSVGRLEQALAEINRARELDPLSRGITSNVGEILYYARRYDEATKEFRRALELDPDFHVAHVFLGHISLFNGRSSDGVARLQHALQLSKNGPVELSHLGYGYAVSGQREQARKVLSELLAKGSAPDLVAHIYAGLGEKDRAFQWLDKAFAARSIRAFVLRADPRFDSLRSDSRLRVLLSRMGLPL